FFPRRPPPAPPPFPYTTLFRSRALARGAHIYCEITGYGMSSDAYHITSPSEDGSGMMRVMQRALKDASLAPEQIEYINAHGTSRSEEHTSELQSLRHLVCRLLL